MNQSSGNCGSQPDTPRPRLLRKGSIGIGSRRRNGYAETPSEFGINIEAMHDALTDGSARAAVTLAEVIGRRHGVRVMPAWLIKDELIAGLRPIAELQRQMAARTII